MLTAGEGGELWHARVDLFTPDGDGSRVSLVAGALAGLLAGEKSGVGLGYGVDQGIGVEGRPVVGLTFWVRARDIGSAAVTALQTARQAGVAAQAGPDCHDVTLVPHSAVYMPVEEHTVRMPD